MVSTGYAANLSDSTRTGLQSGIMFVEHATPSIEGIAGTGSNRLLGVRGEYGCEPLHLRSVGCGFCYWGFRHWVRPPPIPLSLLMNSILGNVYSRVFGGTAFTSMVTGVLFLVPVSQLFRYFSLLFVLSKH